MRAKKKAASPKKQKPFMNAVVLQVLRRTKKLLLDFGWTKGTFARDKWGHQINDTVDVHSELSERATRFCLTGALNRAGRKLTARQLGLLEDAVERKMPFRDDIDWTTWTTEPVRYVTSQWNDLKTTKKSDVIALLDDLIKSYAKKCKSPEKKR